MYFFSEQAVGGVDWAYLDPEKRAYVQSFVENLGDTNSAVTETSDSGLGSSYPPSEIESEATVGEGMVWNLSVTQSYIIYESTK